MKQPVWPSTNIQSIPAQATAVHLARPLSFKKLGELLRKRRITHLGLSASTAKRLSPKSRALLRERGVEVRVERRPGRALEVGFEKILKISELRKDYLSVRRIAELTGVPKSTVHYLLKYADRSKVKKSNQTVYLE